MWHLAVRGCAAAGDVFVVPGLVISAWGLAYAVAAAATLVAPALAFGAAAVAAVAGGLTRAGAGAQGVRVPTAAVPIAQLHIQAILDIRQDPGSVCVGGRSWQRRRADAAAAGARRTHAAFAQIRL